MSIITTFYSNEEKTNALYPITKTKAIYDDNNVNLEQRLNNIKNEIQGISGFTVDLLWTNTNLASDFTAQTIPLNLTNYSAIIVDVLDTKNNIGKGIGPCRTIFIKKGMSELYAGNGTNYTRTYTVNDSGVTISSTNYNHGGVPLRIYGLK